MNDAVYLDKVNAALTRAAREFARDFGDPRANNENKAIALAVLLDTLNVSTDVYS